MAVSLILSQDDTPIQAYFLCSILFMLFQLLKKKYQWRISALKKPQNMLSQTTKEINLIIFQFNVAYR